MEKKDFKKIKEYVFEIPKSYRADMRVPARFFSSEKLLESILRDRSLTQLVNSASLPGVVKYALAMPDIHEGYGLPIGGVVATKLPNGVISPGGVGYDINCGTRLLASHLNVEEVKPYLEDLANALFYNIPSGVGVSGKIRLTPHDMGEVLEKGAKWAFKKGYGIKEDLEHCEENGGMGGANSDAVSERAKHRGKDGLGTLGSGNHFLEIQRVDEIFNQKAASNFGLFPGQLTILIHSGSRGLGHQVCSDYVAFLRQASLKYRIKLADPELVSVPLSSPEGRQYLSAMRAAANFAWANRHCLAHLVREVFKNILSGKIRNLDLFTVYDVAHNIAKIEKYKVNDKEIEVCVHRKGATRSFGPNSKEIPADYQKIGQPVLIPGSMGTASYVLVGTNKAAEETFGSTCHGAGRVMSRKAAKRQIWGEQLEKELIKSGIIPKTKSKPGLAEEAPQAYKDIEEVVKVVDKVGIAKKVARLKPLAVIKG